MKEKKGIAILGSTGSIGRQALDVIERFPDKFEISVLTANQNHSLLIEQAIKHKPNAVVIADETKYTTVKDALWKYDIKVFAGSKSIEQIIELDDTFIVLNALVGFSGLRPTIRAIRAKKTLALANKESLVIAGDFIRRLYNEKRSSIIPVDSEHSAIFQCIVGEFDNPIEKVILTASGGPFRGKSPEYLKKVTMHDALKHPRWDMGAKITIDSATLVNKGFEIIEAKWLYDLRYDQIEILIHPESIIHSFVQFADGSIKAQMSLQDMRIPIQYALSFPERYKNDFPRVDFLKYNSLNFEDVDVQLFPNIKLAYRAMKLGGNTPCILNAGNEIAVQAFLQGKIHFTDIFRINENCLDKISFIQNPTLDDYFETDKETRNYAKTII